GCQLLRVTRRKTRTRTVTIDPESGDLILDHKDHKFSVDAIRDLRVANDASHYRELCKISIEHEQRWLSIIYTVESVRLKVLHVICPNVQILDSLVKSLTRLYHTRLELVGGLGDLSSAAEERIWLDAAAKPKNLTDERQMSFAELEALCQKLSFYAPASQLKHLFEQVDVQQRGSLTFEEFKHFVDLLKARNDIAAIFAGLTSGTMSKECFLSFLKDVQGFDDQADAVERIWERAAGDEEELSLSRFTTFLLSRQNGILRTTEQDMSRPLNEYFISSSHNTYLTGWQIGDEASVEPYIRALQRGCRCIEIDIWSDSAGVPEVRHGHSFTSPVSLESVLRATEKYAFIVSPWPLIVSIELRCSARVQEAAVDLLRSILGDTLVVSRHAQLPSPNDLRYRILLKVKASHGIAEQADFATSIELSELNSEFGEMSTTESDYSTPRSRTSSHSSQSSSVSSYRGSNAPTIAAMLQMAPLLQGIKFRNFSLPESKTVNHIFSLSERHVKSMAQSNPESKTQMLKHNARHLMRVYPSATRVRSTNFAPQEYWRQGVQMVALNWQTHDLGMQLNDALFAASGTEEVSGYRLKPAVMRFWRKGQMSYLEAPDHKQPKRRWRISVLSGTQLPKTSASTRSSPYVELQVLRPHRDLDAKSHSACATDRDIKFRTSIVEDNTFNPQFCHAPFQFVQESEDLEALTFLRFLVHDVPLSNGSATSLSQQTGPVVATWACPLEDLQRGYRVVKLRDLSGEQFIFSSLLV
ncbi:PLC-like phosphodiesterase, partial [Protomyces lactucae-debilis]